MSQVIVDTSVWIDFFRGRMSSDDKLRFTYLVENEILALTNVIAHELVVGSRTKAEFLRIHNLISLFKVFTTCSFPPVELDEFGFKVSKAGLLGRYTDLSIAFLAMKSNAPVWSKDTYFKKLADKKFIDFFY